MDGREVRVPVDLGNGLTLSVEAIDLGGNEKVADVSNAQLDRVAAQVEAVGRKIGAAIAGVGAKTGKVEFGVEFGVESGELTALIVKGTGKASLKITLEWGGS